MAWCTSVCQVDNRKGITYFIGLLSPEIVQSLNFHPVLVLLCEGKSTCAIAISLVLLTTPEDGLSSSRSLLTSSEGRGKDAPSSEECPAQRGQQAHSCDC